MKNYTKIGLAFSGLILVFFLFQLPKRVVDSKSRTLATETIGQGEDDHEENGHDHENESGALSIPDSTKVAELKVQFDTENNSAVKALLADSIAEVFGKNYLVDSALYYYNVISKVYPEVAGHELAGNGYYSLFRLTQNTDIAKRVIDEFNLVLIKDSSRNDLLAKVGFVIVLEGSQPPMKGVGLVKKALANDPNNVEVILRYGELFQIRGSNDKAIEQYQKAVDLAPNNVDVRIYLVEALLASNKRDESIVHLEKIKELNQGQDPFIEDYADRNLKELL